MNNLITRFLSNLGQWHETALTTTTKELSQYKTFIFKDIKVLFQGIGKNTLVSYKVKDIEKQLVIPNEYITVERTQKADN